MLDRETAAVLAGVVSGAVTGLVFTLRAHDLGFPLWQYYHTADVAPVLLTVVVGAIPAVALVRYRLVLPGAILTVAVASWLRADANPLPGEPVLGMLYALLAAYLAAMVVFGWFEFSLRSRSHRLPSPLASELPPK